MAENIINTSAFAIKKIREESDASKDTQVKRIADYLIAYMDKDATFAQLVMQEQKTLAKCMNFIVKKMRDVYTKQNGEKTGGMCADPNDVYLAAIEYYEQDDAAIERERAAAEAVRKAERASSAETQKNKPAPPPSPKAVAPNTTGARKNQSAQMSLFDL